ncbi:MAG: hypothetical protein ACYCYF_14920 [Anaerolineae bacterium]
MISDETSTLDPAKPPYRPTPRDLIMLDELLSVRLSPDGALLAFTVLSADWQNNVYERLCYIHDVAAGTTTPLTRDGVVIQMAWIGDRTLAVLWDGPNPWCSPQVYLYENLIGDPPPQPNGVTLGLFLGPKASELDYPGRLREELGACLLAFVQTARWIE